jgi:hypothetical protein
MLVVLAVAACSKSGGGASLPPTPYTHASPAFTIDLPAGDQLAEESRDLADGLWVSFHGPHPVQVSWELDDESPADERDAVANTQHALGNEVIARGDVAGGAAWVVVDLKGEGPTIDAFLESEGQLLDCTASGSEEALAACKSLRAK